MESNMRASDGRSDSGESVGFPSFSEVLDAYASNPKVRDYAAHNHTCWCSIWGGLSLVGRSPLSFDPVTDYWYLMERRLLVAYFAYRFHGLYVPASSMRRLAVRIFGHFDLARKTGRFGDPALASPQSDVLPRIVDKALEVASELPDIQEYADLRKVWGRRLKTQSVREDLSDFLTEVTKSESLSELEPAFIKRIRWFPYLGLESESGLLARQRFFYGFYELFASTNSYTCGGGMSFAPVLQNNPVQTLIGYVEKWAQGQAPNETGFEVEGKTEKKDRAHHAPVVELFGFLNLHGIPFYNSVTADVYDLFGEPGDKSVYERLKRIGNKTIGFLSEHPEVVRDLAPEFRRLAEVPKEEPAVIMEGISQQSVALQFPREAEAQAETVLLRETTAAAVIRAGKMTDLEAATAMLHLILDAGIYGRKVIVPPIVVPIPPPGIKTESLRLPFSLRPTGNDALGYLRAGHHVLFAGPPGTGKTTLAQLVGYAWNKRLSVVPDECSVAELPITTVGNSAWAPFHTIGGILPQEGGKFKAHRGVFIDPQFEEKGEWKLRPDCLIIDEMNRADLDRCIGELYPLLSKSVERVCPAGIPGVTSIRFDPNFRLIATVNDATLDDVVFPISEGLARRFIRIELSGATNAELAEFLIEGIVEQDSRRTAALRTIGMLFEVCSAEGRLSKSEMGDHLPFGVGYFQTLRSWVRGELELSNEFRERDLLDQAKLVAQTSLTSAARLRGLEGILTKFNRLEGNA